MSLLLLNYFEFNFILAIMFSLTKGQIYRGFLSHILDIPSILFLFDLIYPVYHLIYPAYSNANFTFWKTWYNDYKCVTPGISQEKISFKKNFLASSPFPCHITGICRYTNDAFAQSKVLLFWRCHDFPDLLWNLLIGWRTNKWDWKRYWKLVMAGGAILHSSPKKEP